MTEASLFPIIIVSFAYSKVKIESKKNSGTFELFVSFTVLNSILNVSEYSYFIPFKPDDNSVKINEIIYLHSSTLFNFNILIAVCVKLYIFNSIFFL